jgi:hypothetical protein
MDGWMAGYTVLGWAWSWPEAGLKLLYTLSFRPMYLVTTGKRVEDDMAWHRRT